MGDLAESSPRPSLTLGMFAAGRVRQRRRSAAHANGKNRDVSDLAAMLHTHA